MVIPTIILRGLFIVPLIIIGVCTSYSDIRLGKIKNTHLTFGYIYAIFLYLFLAYYSIFVIHQPGNLKYILELMINGGIAFGLGYLLWYFNLWAAGDAKIFPLYSLLIPLEFYSKNHVTNFPSLVLLTDTFTIICMGLLLKIIVKATPTFLKFLKNPTPLPTLLSKVNYKNIRNKAIETGKLFIFSACFLVVMQLLMTKFSFIGKANIFGIPLSYLLFFPLQMYFSKKLSKNKISILIVCLAGVLAGLYFINSNQTSILLMTLKMSVILLAIFGIGVQLVHQYIDRQEISMVRLINLAPGSFLGPESVNEIRNKFKGKGKSSCVNLNCSDGLSKSQIKTIQKMYKDDLPKEVYVCRTFPFAPYMFAAFIFTVTAGQSFLFFLLHR